MNSYTNSVLVKRQASNEVHFYIKYSKLSNFGADSIHVWFRKLFDFEYSAILN